MSSNFLIPCIFLFQMTMCLGVFSVNASSHNKFQNNLCIAWLFVKFLLI